jgi:hypothetical protein
VSVGRRGALERTGHFLLELGERLQQAEVDDRYDYDCPLSQTALADTLGLSAIHVNRTLRELREQALLTFRRGRVTISDPHRLTALCGFDADYLHPSPQSADGHRVLQKTISSTPTSGSGCVRDGAASKPTSTQ